jgi:hypothetical protein
MKQGRNVIYKWCETQTGKGHWLLTHVTFLRGGDRYKIDSDVFMATTDPFYKESIKEFTVNFVKVE